MRLAENVPYLITVLCCRRAISQPSPSQKIHRVCWSTWFLTNDFLAQVTLCMLTKELTTTTTTAAAGKTSLKNPFAFFETLSRWFFLAHLFAGVKYNAHIQVLNRNLKKILLRVFRFSIKQPIYENSVTSWSCSERQRNVPKSVMHVQNCYFAHASSGAVYMGRRIPVVPFPKL